MQGAEQADKKQSLDQAMALAEAQLFPQFMDYLLKAADENLPPAPVMLALAAAMGRYCGAMCETVALDGMEDEARRGLLRSFRAGLGLEDKAE